jgi:hypothetical protein
VNEPSTAAIAENNSNSTNDSGMTFRQPSSIRVHGHGSRAIPALSVIQGEASKVVVMRGPMNSARPFALATNVPTTRYYCVLPISMDGNTMLLILLQQSSKYRSGWVCRGTGPDTGNCHNKIGWWRRGSRSDGPSFDLESKRKRKKVRWSLIQYGSVIVMLSCCCCGAPLPC